MCWRFCKPGHVIQTQDISFGGEEWNMPTGWRGQDEYVVVCIPFWHFLSQHYHLENIQKRPAIFPKLLLILASYACRFSVILFSVPLFSLTPVAPNLFYAVAHLSLPAERRGPPSHTTIEKSNLSLHLGTNMSKQNMFLWQYIEFYLRLMSASHSRLRNRLSLWFLQLCVVFDKIGNSWLLCGKSVSKIVSWSKVESVSIFSFHVQ